MLRPDQLINGRLSLTKDDLKKVRFRQSLKPADRSVNDYFAKVVEENLQILISMSATWTGVAERLSVRIVFYSTHVLCR
jgi:hypothetical protein